MLTVVNYWIIMWNHGRRVIEKEIILPIEHQIGQIGSKVIQTVELA